jgi:hypothetical protein
VAEARWYSAGELRRASFEAPDGMEDGAAGRAPGEQAGAWSLPLAFASTQDEVRRWLAQLEDNAKESL